MKKVTLVPSYWGFDLGMNVSTDEMYKMLTIIDKHADELAKLRSELQADRRRQDGGVPEAAIEIDLYLVPIHPGLAKYLKEKNQWDSKLDSHVAKATM